jgi:hypothetical protein
MEQVGVYKRITGVVGSRWWGRWVNIDSKSGRVTIETRNDGVLFSGTLTDTVVDLLKSAGLRRIRVDGREVSR